MDEQNLKLEFNLDYIKILQEDEDVSMCQLDLLHLGVNRNKCNISKECLEKSISSFYNKPIIYRLNNKYFPEEGTDVVEHARDEQQEKTTFIGGTIPESSPVEYIERDEKEYVRMVGVIHKLYQPTLLKILESRNGEVKVSIELKVIDGCQDENGILVINEFKLLSVCLLGNGIPEGIEGSQLVVTKFSMDDYNKHYLNFTKIEDVLGINQDGVPDVEVNIEAPLSTDLQTEEEVKNIEEDVVIIEDNIQETAIAEEEPIILKDSLVGLEPTFNINKEKEDKKVVNKATEKFSLTSDQIYEILRNAVSSFKYISGVYECNKYWIRDYDENVFYVCDEEDGKKYQVPYTIENDVATIDLENKKEVISGGYKVVGEVEEVIANTEVETPAEELTETPEEELAEEVVENTEDTTDWKGKFELVDSEHKMALEELAKYKKAEEDQKMMNLLESFAHCYSLEEKEVMKADIAKCSFADFEKKVNNKVKEFALKMKDQKVEEPEKVENAEVVEEVQKNTLQFSVSPFGIIPTYDFSKNFGEGGLDSIIKNSGVKVK